jgi:type IV pilus assembly protein PilP
MMRRDLSSGRFARAAVVAGLALAALAGCSSRDAELDEFIEATRKETGGDVAPLPEVRPYQSFTYAAMEKRSPFMPALGGAGGGGANSALRPDSKRNREFLEGFSLDTLRMVGTLKLSGKTFGLVKTKDGLVHRVLPGNYLGQADGRIVEISASKIAVTEIVPDGLGGYMERPAQLALNE